MISWRRGIALALVFGSVLGIGCQGAQAETLSVNRSATVSASIKQTQVPPTPILISPPNGAMLTSGVVTFVWKNGGEHIAPLSHYELSLNGQKKFGNIQLTNESNSEYILTFDGTQYSLKLTNDHWLPDGAYTWKIRVVDANNLGTDSTTWSFTIDSQPPPLLIVEVDGQTTSISAADPTTVPAQPIVVKHVDPIVKGKTQALSEVQLEVTYPDGHTWLYKTFASEFGDFTFRLEELPNNQPVHLRFTAIDPWFNATVLSGIQLIYQSRVIHIVIPLPIPHPPVLDIYYTLPRLPTFLATPTPQVVVSPLPTSMPTPMGQPVVRVVEVPTFPLSPWLLGWLLAIVGYVVTLFWLSGNRWRYFLDFGWNLLKWWIWGAGKQPHRLIRWWERIPVPLVRFEIWWMDARRRSRRRALWSSPLGTWDFLAVADQIYSVKSTHPHWQYPVDWEALNLSATSQTPTPWRGISEAIDSQHHTLFLNGESFILNGTGKQYATNSETVAVPSALDYHWEVWLNPVPRSRKLLLARLPRLLLWLATIIGLVITVFRRDAGSVILLLIPLGMAWRDAQWQIPKRLQIAYEAK
jgi:hypothetical protein